MNACILFDSRYGNTEKVALSLAKGMRRSSVEVWCYSIREVPAQVLHHSDFVALGGPTEYRGASELMREFLKRLGDADLSGKCGFAFDTRTGSLFSGSAAAYIEKALEASGVKILRPRASALVRTAKRDGRTAKKEETRAERGARVAREVEEERSSAVLEDGALVQFEGIGADLGASLTKLRPGA